MAPAPGAQITLVAPDYSLAPPLAREIVRQMRAAIVWLHRHGAGTASSAATGRRPSPARSSPVAGAPSACPRTDQGAMPASGLFDLEPITRSSSMNGWG
jgi:hypothetical protein